MKLYLKNLVFLIFSLFLFFAWLLISPGNANANLIENGNFSLGNQGFTTGYTYQASKPPDMPGGKYGVSDQAFDLHNAFSTNYGNTTGLAGDNYFIANGGDGSVTEVVWQTASPISVSAAGIVYRFEAHVTKVFPHNPPILRFQLGDGTTWRNLGDSPAIDGSAVGEWVFTFADGKFTSPGNYYLRLINIETAEYGNDFGIDDIYFGFRTNAPSVGDTPGDPDESIVEFNTSGMNSTPEITTQTITGIGTTSATGNGNITNLGDPNPTEHGHVWSTSLNPTIDDSKTELGAAIITGAFTSSLTGLTAGTTYYVRAYAINTEGTSYGNQESFTTLNVYAVTYNANEATGGNIPEVQTKIEDETLALATNSGNLVRLGYTFDGWNTQADGLGTDYVAGSEYTANIAVQLFTKWAINQYTITFTASTGGSIIGTTSQTINHGSDGLEVTAVADTEYLFVYWSDNSTINPRIDINVTENKTISAVFEKIKSTSSGSTAFSRYNNLLAMGKITEAEQLAKQFPNQIDRYLEIKKETKFIFTKNLKQRIIDSEVKELQKFLNNQGYFVATTGLGSKGFETNYFRKLTKQAVIKFQLANGLIGDGIVGPLTRAVLNK